KYLTSFDVLIPSWEQGYIEASDPLTRPPRPPSLVDAYHKLSLASGISLGEAQGNCPRRRGIRQMGESAPEGRQTRRNNLSPIRILSPLPGLVSCMTLTHGWRRGLRSDAALRGYPMTPTLHHLGHKLHQSLTFFVSK